MLSRPQQILLKRAQREAGVSDDEYRGTLQMIAGCRSSTSPALTDGHLDKLLAYFEAIYWRAVDAALLQPSGNAAAVFRQRGHWSAKNTRLETSRDRFIEANLGRSVADLEARLAALGYGASYCAAIRQNVTKGRDAASEAHALHLYRAALERTLQAKEKRSQVADRPF